MGKESNIAEVIDNLQAAGLDKNRHIELGINRFKRTGDVGLLIRYLQKHPKIYQRALIRAFTQKYDEQDNPFKPWPTHLEAVESLAGDAELFQCNAHGDIFGLDDTHLIYNLALTGAPGGGKSTALGHMSIALANRTRDYNLLWFNLVKLESRNLVHAIPKAKVITKERLRINPWECPPGRSIKDHINMVAVDVLVSEAYLGGYSLNEITVLINDIYQENGCYDGSQNWPTMHQLLKRVEAKLEDTQSFRVRDILLGIQNRLVAFINCEVFDCVAGIPLHVFQTEDLIIELNGLPDNVANLIPAFIVRNMFIDNIQNGKADGKPRHGIIIDEASVLMQADRDTKDFGQGSINKDILRCRAAGIWFLFATQTSYSISKNIRAAIGTKIAMQVSDAEELDWIQQGLLLNQEQRDHIARMPRFGQAVVFAIGRFPRPFLTYIPHLDLPSVTTDQELIDRFTDFWAELATYVTPLDAHVHTAEEFELPKMMPPEAGSLGKVIARNQDEPVSVIRNKADMLNNSEFELGLQWLLSNKIIIEQSINVSGTKPSRFFQIADQALASLGAKSLPGKGSWEHRLYQSILLRYAKSQGWKAKIEGRMPERQKQADVMAVLRNGHFIALEVSLNHNILVDSIILDLMDGVAEVMVVTRVGEVEAAKDVVCASSVLEPYIPVISFQPISYFYKEIK